MAKEEMICPFSGKLCRECPLYRGRHYYLCFSKKYRGHLEKTKVVTKETSPSTSYVKLDDEFKIPIKIPNAIDPYDRSMEDIT